MNQLGFLGVHDGLREDSTLALSRFYTLLHKWDAPLQHGVFTYTLLQWLRVQGGGKVVQLDKYLKHKVQELNRKYQKPQQTPYTSVEPLTKLDLILAPKSVTSTDYLWLKSTVEEGKNEKDFELDRNNQSRTLEKFPFLLTNNLTRRQFIGIFGVGGIGGIWLVQKLGRGITPAHFKELNRPVEQVSGYDAVEFCDRLSIKTKRQFRLPSGEEWEYACRAKTTTPFHFGETLTPDLANYNGIYIYANGPKGKYRKETTVVGIFLPNAFGLYDMHGNVWEWCLDYWHDIYNEFLTLLENDAMSRLVRGGSYVNSPMECRSSYRKIFNPNSRNKHIGFRVVCEAPRTL
jgi:formylglycine-generating enzyme required for sulfatase activity